MTDINQAMNEAAKKVLDKLTLDLFDDTEVSTGATITDSGNLSQADIEAYYELLKSLEPPTLYYALSDFMPDKSNYYKMPVEGTDELWMMHPDIFPRFQFEAIRAGYRLIDYKTVSTLPKPIRWQAQ